MGHGRICWVQERAAAIRVDELIPEAVGRRQFESDPSCLKASRQLIVRMAPGSPSPFLRRVRLSREGAEFAEQIVGVMQDGSVSLCGGDGADSAWMALPIMLAGCGAYALEKRSESGVSEA